MLIQILRGVVENEVQAPKRTNNRILDPDVGQKVCKGERRSQEGTGGRIVFFPMVTLERQCLSSLLRELPAKC